MRGFLLAAVLWVVVPSLAWGQAGEEDVRPLDLGGTATTAGHAALFDNPARLLADDLAGWPAGDRRITVTVGHVQAYGGGDLLQFSRYDEALVQEEPLSDREAQSAVDSWFGGQERGARAYAEVRPVAVTIRARDGRWAAGGAVRTRTMARAAIDEGWLDLALRGTTPARELPLNGRSAATVMTDLTVAYARHFESHNLKVGVAPRLVVGHSRAEGDFDSSLSVASEEITHRFDYQVQAAGQPAAEVVDSFNAFASSPLGGATLSNPIGRIAGWGGGIDLGASYDLSAQAGLSYPLEVAVSLTDLGALRWNSRTQRVTPRGDTFQYDGVVFDQSRIQDEHDGNIATYFRSTLDSLATDAYQDVERSQDAFTTSLPATLHLGAVGKPLGGATRLHLGASAALHSSLAPTLHLAAERQLGPIPLRGGLRLGGDHALALGMRTGVHVRTFRFEVGLTATPTTSSVGSGGRYALELSLATVQL